ncbi:hypothetical protein LY78DRAFT_686834 [Colletotrichum sublineola]|uniref:Putative Ulp1 protease family protein n=1 Tax=Colletotrichum sublineola TaxID=1173701 RepID=A0A066XRY3_COLSU|nr:hypothetical protein LY78DRAFT_686834 [Colletotrichum sublineola]KDN71612.1 putative Ulp1 protease family protein [Colletotrichum sublineola]
MSVQSLLNRLNLLGQQVNDRKDILDLWKDLRLEFLRDPTLTTQKFPSWALKNVHPKALALVTNTIYVNNIDGLRGDISRRLKNISTRFNSTPGVFIFCFGITITSSRACLDALNALQQSHPQVSLVDLYNRYLETHADGPGRKGTSKELAKIRLAIQRFNPDIWNKHHPHLTRSTPQPASRPGLAIELEPDNIIAAPSAAVAAVEHESDQEPEQDPAQDPEQDPDFDLDGNDFDDNQGLPAAESHSDTDSDNNRHHHNYDY